MVCCQMAHKDDSHTMKAIAALTVNDRVVRSDEYTRCGQLGMVKGVMDRV